MLKCVQKWGGGKVTDEKVIEALLTCKTRKKAAESLGVSANTINRRFEKPDFKAKYNKARAEMLDDAVNNLRGNVSLAVDTLATIAKDEGVAAAIRVNAADALLKHNVKYIEVIDHEQRITELENLQGVVDE